MNPFMTLARTETSGTAPCSSGWPGGKHENFDDRTTLQDDDGPLDVPVGAHGGRFPGRTGNPLPGRAPREGGPKLAKDLLPRPVGLFRLLQVPPARGRPGDFL